MREPTRFHALGGRTALLIVLVTLGVASCGDESLPTEAEIEQPVLAADATRPMKISAELEEGGVIVPAPAPCLLLFNQVIRGNATHLGRFEGVGTACILDVVIPDPDPPFLAPGPAPYRSATFSNPLWVLTAANGDELWLEAPDAVAVVSLVDNSLRAEAIQTIIGGTGRFEGATGVLESEAVNEDGQGPNDFESRGWIRF